VSLAKTPLVLSAPPVRRPTQDHTQRRALFEKGRRVANTQDDVHAAPP
jgi:hypothetical protein